MKWINVFFSICIFLCVIFFNNPKVFAQRNLLHEGDSLFQAGNFFEAAIAYERAFFYASNNIDRTRANLSKANALKQQGAFSRAFSDLQRSLPMAVGDSLRMEVLYETAFCAFMAGEYLQANSVISQFIYQFPEALTYKEYSLLKGLVLVRLNKWDELSEHVPTMALHRQATLQNNQLVAQLHNLLLDENRPSMRNPEKASLLSTIIPGSGHFYARSPGKGILNGFSQLASLGVAIAFGVNQLYISGFVIGLGAFQSFYFGGIKQAESLTQQNNLEKMNEYQAQIEKLLHEIFQLPSS